MSYNGWKNYETWNANLWIANDYGLYCAACEYVSISTTIDYDEFLEFAGLEHDFTGDGVAWNDSGIDREEMREALEELI